MNGIPRIEIRDRQSRKLITMIEVLSPSNKRDGPDRGAGMVQRGLAILHHISLVEIDLLRGGPRMPEPAIPVCDYCVTVGWSSRMPEFELWLMKLADRLPTIPIPLTEDVPAATLDLQALLDEVYDAAGYEDYLYSSPPEPPLDTEQSEWARQSIPEEIQQH